MCTTTKRRQLLRLEPKLPRQIELSATCLGGRPNLELVPQRQLSDASIDSRIADHTERRRGEVASGFAN